MNGRPSTNYSSCSTPELTQHLTSHSSGVSHVASCTSIFCRPIHFCLSNYITQQPCKVCLMTQTDMSSNPASATIFVSWGTIQPLGLSFLFRKKVWITPGPTSQSCRIGSDDAHKVFSLGSVTQTEQKVAMT